ncbi:MAG: 5-(carboxyamino)imidazole ribonucleotide mutase [Planctomycetes bacterium]|nr:5-(carboxyamino)imidazole ribonucleotide mutase [Planctomycetota bacterium]
MEKTSSVSIVMGSESDMPVMQGAIDQLKEFGAPFSVHILSAHRTPDELKAMVIDAPKKGVKVFIAAAGGAAHLAGVVASHTVLPVIGVPMQTQALGGLDSLLSMVQMPSGIPVGTMAIGQAGAKNAAIYAVQILAVSDAKYAKVLHEFRQKLAKKVLMSNK